MTAVIYFINLYRDLHKGKEYGPILIGTALMVEVYQDGAWGPRRRYAERRRVRLERIGTADMVRMMDGGPTEAREIYRRFAHLRTLEDFPLVRPGKATVMATPDQARRIARSLGMRANPPLFAPAAELLAFMAETTRAWDGEESDLLGIMRPEGRQERPVSTVEGMSSWLKRRGLKRSG